MGLTDDDLERCPFCGARVETPCDEPPIDTCETALIATYMGKEPDDANLHRPA